jgi:hypothetical protein
VAMLTIQVARSGSSFTFAAPTPMYVSVTDDQGMPVVGLTRDNFLLTIIEPVWLDLFKDSTVPIEIMDVDPYGLGPGFYEVWLQPSTEWAGYSGPAVSLGLAVVRERIGPSQGGVETSSGLEVPLLVRDNGQTVITLDIV